MLDTISILGTVGLVVFAIYTLITNLINVHTTYYGYQSQVELACIEAKASWVPLVVLTNNVPISYGFGCQYKAP